MLPVHQATRHARDPVPCRPGYWPAQAGTDTTQPNRYSAEHQAICGARRIHYENRQDGRPGRQTRSAPAAGKPERPRPANSAFRQPQRLRSLAQRSQPGLRSWRVLDEILPNTAEDGAGQLFLVGIVVEARLFFRVGDEGGFDQRRRDIRGLEYGETGLFDTGLMERVDRTEFAEQVFAEFQAVIDGRRLRQVEQRAGEEQILVADIHATDQIGLVFLLCKQAGLGARGAFFGQYEDGRATRIRLDPAIGMNRQEEIGLYPARLLDAHLQRHEEIGITRQHRTHVRLGVNARLEIGR